MSDKTCIICASSPQSVTCLNGHEMCQTCFQLQVTSQCDSSSNGKFAENDSHIICAYCKVVFSDRFVISHVDDETYERFAKAKADAVAAKTHRECEIEFVQKQKQSKIAAHKTYICEKILTLHCTKCDAAVYDFNGCFAIECATCKGSMCGWCMKDFSPDAHAHVRNCEHSLSKGSVFGTEEQFKSVHKKNKTAQVIKYLDSIFDENERKEVVKVIKKELDDLEIDIESRPDQEQLHPAPIVRNDNAEHAGDYPDLVQRARANARNRAAGVNGEEFLARYRAAENRARQIFADVARDPPAQRHNNGGQRIGGLERDAIIKYNYEINYNSKYNYEINYNSKCNYEIKYNKNINKIYFN